MPLQKLSLPIMFSQSSDETSLPDQMGARLVNGWVEKIGQKPIIRKLFGLELLTDIAVEYPVDGLYWWDAQNITIFVINGTIYKMSNVGGSYSSITGDALVVKGPVTFASNSWCLFMASGGRIVTWHLYGSPITAPGLTLATTKDKLKFSAFTYYIAGVSYSKGAIDNFSPGTDVIPEDKYGAVALDIDYAGTVTAVSATANATGYGSAVLAVAGIPACATDKCRIGWVTVMKSDGAFTFETTEFDAANVTEVYTDNTLYSVETTKYLADADAPTSVSHVAWLDDYFLANDIGSARFWWSDGGDPTSWGALSYATAEGHSDLLQALHVAWLEVTLFGRDSLETFYNDGESPFSRISGGVLEQGCLAPYSIVNADGIWVWLSKRRQVITLEGRAYSIKSGPYDSIISEIHDPTGAWSVHMTIAGHSFYCISFPTVKRTFVWNMTTDTWAEWGTWDSETATYGLWKGKSYCYARTWDLHLLGDSASGKIYKIMPTLFREDSEAIRSYMKTALTDHGTTIKKRSRRMKINVKRGQGLAGGAEPVFTMRYKDNNRAWSNERHIGLGEIGETPNIVEIRHLGLYATRQYEFTHSDNSDFILNGIEEETEALE
jgi:hypothetical protein